MGVMAGLGVMAVKVGAARVGVARGDGEGGGR